MTIRSMIAMMGFWAVVLAWNSPAFANGFGFFDDDHEHEAELQGTVYFGTVKDAKGKAVADAQVKIRIKDQGVEIIRMTNPVGIYRSTDVPKDIDPANVEVSVAKPGFVEAGKVNRLRTTKPGLPVQIDFVLKADERASNN